MRLGTRLGRYMLLEELGRGGMGIVVAAYDAELDRKVALKLLKPAQRVSGRARMHREAQSLAKLQHPNIVSVFEVDEIDGLMFVAMEYVQGHTIDTWVRQNSPSWREIMLLAGQAGRGLAAAHAVGLVHRDFKPGNVLVGERGRVRVVDFGIAIAAGAASTGAPASVLERSGELAGSLTETGSVVGTPGFMAPEQYTQQTVDAKSDQFAFCVTVYRLLYDHPPFQGVNHRELRTAIHSAEITPPPPDSDVPLWLRRTLIRGLAAEANDRWPSMNALLAEIAAGMRTTKRGRIVVGTGAAAAGIAAVLLALPPGETEPECAPAGTELAGIWDERHREQMHQAFVDTEVSYAEQSFELAAARLDAQAEQWSRLEADVCEAARAAPSAVHDLQRSCLARRRGELAATVEVFAEADRGVVARATDAAAKLTPVAGCRDVDALQARLQPPPPDVAPAVAATRDEIARANALLAAGRTPDALRVARHAVQLAEQNGYTPCVLEANDALGRGLYEDGDLDAAEAVLSETALSAIGAHHDEIAARAAAQVAFIVGYRKAKHAEGLVWARHAAAAVARHGAGTAVEASYLLTLGGIESGRGDYEAARIAFTRALEIQTALLGAEHPHLAATQNNLGSVHIHDGDYEQAQVLFEHALENFAVSYGSEHPRVATALTGLGVLYERLHKYDQAEQTHARALKIRTNAFGERSADAALSLGNLASAILAKGEFERAAQHAQLALEIREETVGADHPHTASSLTNLGLIAEKRRDWAEAVRLNKRAVRIFDAALGPKHPYVAHPLTSLGRALLERGEGPSAVTHLQRALEIREASSTPEEVGETRFALARALWGVDEQARAVTLAQLARAQLTGQDQQAVDSWLAAHPVPPR